MSLNIPSNATLVSVKIEVYRPGEAANLGHGTAMGFTDTSDPYALTFTFDTQTQLAAAFVELAASMMLPP
jgi:hypothetical protein